MAVQDSGANNAPQQPLLKNSIKQKKAEIRRITDLGDVYEVSVMSSRSDVDFPEPHLFTVDKDDIGQLLEKINCESVEQAQELLPRNPNGQPCEGNGISVWIAHTHPGGFGWEISVLTNKRIKKGEQ